MRFYSTLILIMIATLHSFSQSVINVTGMVSDRIDKAPIPYATLYNKVYSVYSICDSTGKFSLRVSLTNQNFYLVISSIGYLNDTLSFENLKSDNFKSIFLIPKPEELPVATIDAMTAKTIVQKAIEAIPQNYFDSTFVFNANYCQYHFEKRTNDTCSIAVRFITADADVLQQLSGDKANLHAMEKVRIINLLRSNVYEKNKEQHGDHLMDLLAENPIYHQSGTVLNIKALNCYRFYYDTSKTENDSNYCIHFESVRNDQPKFEHGALTIDKSNFAILSINIDEYANSKFNSRKIYSSSAPYKWDFIDGNFEINFKKQNKKYMVENCYRKYTHKLIDNKIQSPAFELTECFELKVQYQIANENVKEMHSKFSEFSNLYSCKKSFDEINYLKFLDTNFHYIDNMEKEKLKNDLEKLIPLKQQFKNNSLMQ
jgi:hypothetical protein